MANQIVLQIRVDSDLKEQVADIFDQIGIDIPTAVRMFFKATVREKRLPIDTSIEGRRPPTVFVIRNTAVTGSEEDEEEETENARTDQRIREQHMPGQMKTV